MLGSDWHSLGFFNCTVANNTADLDGNDDGNGGGVYRSSGTTDLFIANTILAGNHDLSVGTVLSINPDCSGSISSEGYNLIGAVSAIVGIGGGSMTVPFLHACRVDMRQAVATSSACGLPIALSGTLGFVWAGWGQAQLPPLSSGFVYWPAFAGIVLTSTLLAPVGARLAHSLPLDVLKRAFALLLLVVGLKLLLD